MYTIHCTKTYLDDSQEFEAEECITKITQNDEVIALYDIKSETIDFSCLKNSVGEVVEYIENETIRKHAKIVKVVIPEEADDKIGKLELEFL